MTVHAPGWRCYRDDGDTLLSTAERGMAGEVRAFEFDDFRFEPAEARLSRGGALVELEPKAIAVLACMVAQPGHLHARDELIDAVWGHRHITPSTLNRIITLLRQALGDDSSHPRYIETVPRRGYRFVAPVRAVDDTLPVVTGQQLFRPPPLPLRVEAQLTREVELAALRPLLEQARLLTLLGPGGIGKTELALDLARGMAERYDDGVWLVDLSSCASQDDVADALMATFQLARQAGTSPVDQLVATFKPRAMLLLLDSCERVAAGCAALAGELLSKCPGLSILATSQVRLGMEGEQDYRVPPLSLPDEDWASSSDPLSVARAAESVRLLELRAREADPRFVLDAGNIEAVVGLCRRLEGLPLALELAASRLRVLGPHELLERIDGQQEVLVADWHGGPERHRTVRDMLDWSFRLLSADEAQLLQRLALFAGGWTLEGAEALMRDGKGNGKRDIVGPLGALVDKSFVLVDHEARPRRFRMLESVRDYARELVESDPRRDEYRGRHLRHYLELTRRADGKLYREPQHWYGQWIAREQANLRLAFEFAEARMPEQALQLALNLRWYWWMVGDFQRSQDWIRRALHAHPAASIAERAKALQFIGAIDVHLLRFESAEETLGIAVPAARRAGLPRELGYSLAASAALRTHSGDGAVARRMLSQSMRAALNDDDVQVLGYALIWASVMHSLQGRHRLAWISADRAVADLSALWQRLGSAPGFLLGFAQVNVGLQAYYLGDLDGAARAFDDAIELGIALHNLRVSGAGLEGFGYVLARLGEPLLAARVLGSAWGVRDLTGVPLFGHWQPARREAWDTLAAAVGDEAQVQFERGQHERLESVLDALQAAYPRLHLAAADVRALAVAAPA